MSKKILMATGNYWTSPYHVGSHQIAKLFVKDGWEVLFISDPISPFHFLMKNKRGEVLNRYAIYKNRIDSGYKNLNTYVPMALFTPNEKPLFNMGVVANYWHKFTMPNIIKYVKQAGFGKVDLLWFDSFVQHFWIDEIEYKKSILRVADRNDAFKKVNLHLKKLEKKLMNKVNRIIYTATTLEAYLCEYKSKLNYVPNGVEIEHFLNSNREIPEDLNKIPKPIAIYVGAISEWFGVDFLHKVVRNCRNISFVLIGKEDVDISKLREEPNIFILGPRKYNEIPRYLHNSDIGIIPFNVKHPIVKSINPLKLYEYMACGLPVVTTKWEELEVINSPAYLARDSDDFVNGLRSALQEKNKNKYIQFAKHNTWKESYRKINTIWLNSG